MRSSQAHLQYYPEGSISAHKQQGIGDGFIPRILDRNVYDEVITVDDDDALATARQLARKEGLIVGISSGSNVYAAIKVAKLLGTGAIVVTVLPDTGERYFSTELFDF